ncbi:hypothetical protein QQG55_14525 [Brugia pahangi]
MFAERKNALLTKRATTSVNRKLGADWTRISRGRKSIFLCNSKRITGVCASVNANILKSVYYLETKVASVMINCIHALSKERTVASWNIRIVRLKKVGNARKCL